MQAKMASGCGATVYVFIFTRTSDKKSDVLGTYIDHYILLDIMDINFLCYIAIIEKIYNFSKVLTAFVIKIV